MFEDFANCIFCNSTLDGARSKEGEHVFPESIYGFWRSHDVCADCQQVLGNEVDSLATQTVPILNAMEGLKLKDTGAQLDHLQWSAEDTLDKRKVPVVKRGSTFRPKVTRNQNSFQCPENDLGKLARLWLRQLTQARLSDQEFDAEFARFSDGYWRLKAGETYRSEIFRCSVRRGHMTNVRVDVPIPPTFTRLIAKIVTYFLHYAFPHDKLVTIEEFQMLRDHARYGHSLKPFTINPIPPLHEGQYLPFHRVAVYPDKGMPMVDTTFFGNMGWRTVLHTTEPLFIADAEGLPVEAMFFVLEFGDLAKRQKYIGVKYPNNGGSRRYDVKE